MQHGQRTDDKKWMIDSLLQRGLENEQAIRNKWSVCLLQRGQRTDNKRTGNNK